MSMQVPRRIVVVGASDAGCRFALAAQSEGHEVTLVDEQPQALRNMSFDAPYFFGAALPASLLNENAVAQSVLEASPALMECFEAGVDVRMSTILWGAFRSGENSLHIGTPKAGLVTRDGNELLEHDVLVIAAGMRDFVPSFAGWELPGVFGAKAGLALLETYGVFEGKRVLVLGTSDIAERFTRAALARGVEIVGMVEPSELSAAGPGAALADEGVTVHFNRVIARAIGTSAVEGALLVSPDGTPGEEVSCDAIAVAIASLPNVELPSAMHCAMRFDPRSGSWIPDVSVQGETSREGVFYLSRMTGAGDDTIRRMLDRIAGADVDPTPGELAASGDANGYIRSWVDALHATGGPDIVMCQCEEVTRGEFCDLSPPRYLGPASRPAKSVANPGGAWRSPRFNQDLAKRMTRVGMGHCQGKRCRDEAAFALAERFGVDLQDIRPASYRFPLRPIDLGLIAADDETEEIRANWQMWPYETRDA